MIRKAKVQDIDAIHDLVTPQAALEKMLPRTRENIEAHLRDFFVYEREGRIIGACSLVYGAHGMVEVRSLAVHPDHYRQGVGRGLVRACIADAAALGYERIFALTYVVPLFEGLGFQTIPMEMLPDKIWQDCQACPHQDSCDETAVIRDLKPMHAGPGAEAAPGVRRQPVWT